MILNAVNEFFTNQNFYIMKRLLLLIGIVAILSTFTVAQQTKAEKKAENEAEGNAKFKKAVEAIDAKDFVIVVDMFRKGSNWFPTTDFTNFFSYEKQSAYIQGAIFFGLTYPSSHKLDVSDYKQLVDKKGNVRVEMFVRGSMTKGKIEIFVRKGGNNADVIYTMRGFVVRYSGEVVPTAESNYFKRPNEV